VIPPTAGIYAAGSLADVAGVHPSTRFARSGQATAVATSVAGCGAAKNILNSQSVFVFVFLSVTLCRMSVKYSIVIPAYNEAKTIEQAVKETERVFRSLGESFEIIVVNDGSSDETGSVVESIIRDGIPVNLIRHDKNLGKGAAVRTGVLASQGDWVLVMDSDLSVSPDDFGCFLPLLDANDIVIGSRTDRASVIAERQPFYRIALGKMFNALFVRGLLGLPFHDTQCGFKVYRKETKPLFQELKSVGWAFDVELLIRAQQSGLRVKEVPVVWRHGRVSRVRLRDAAQILKEIWRMKVRR
jgi:dolichyl-phosphate beta-glucosyltransferase